MATAKIGTLVIRTLAKPISSRIKNQAKEHERFRNVCVSLAQFMYRSEVRLRTNLLGESMKNIRPLSEAKAIENGANALAEGFLFGVAAILILGETYRSSRNQSKRRDVVDDRMEELTAQIADLKELGAKWESWAETVEERWALEKQRNDELTRILERVLKVELESAQADGITSRSTFTLPRSSTAKTPGSSESKQDGTDNQRPP